MVSETRVGGELLRTLKVAIEAKRRQIQEGILLWAGTNSPHYPWRQAGKTPYQVFIGEFWLKETVPETAIQLYERFLHVFFTFRALAAAGEDELKDMLADFRLEEHAGNLKLAVQCLLEAGRGGLPGDSEAYLRICGFENHSIRVIMCFGYDLPVAVVDANVSRMISRIFKTTLPSRPSPGLLQTVAESLPPERDPQRYNSGLLDLSELICQEKVPVCVRCPVVQACDQALSVS